MRVKALAAFCGLSLGLLNASAAWAQYGPQPYMPNGYSPNRYAPTRYAPDQYGPERYDPNRYGPARYAPNRYAADGRSSYPQPEPAYYPDPGYRPDPGHRPDNRFRPVSGYRPEAPGGYREGFAGDVRYQPANARPPRYPRGGSNYELNGPRPAYDGRPAPRYPYYPARYEMQRYGDGQPMDESALAPPANGLASPSDQPPMGPTQPQRPMAPHKPRPAEPALGHMAPNRAPQDGYHIGPAPGCHPGEFGFQDGFHGPYYDGRGYVGGYACDGGVDSFCEPPPPVRSAWYGSISGLLLTRDNENEVWFSYDTNNIASQTMGSLDAHMDWRFGFDVRVGKYCDDGLTSYEGVYFGIVSGESEFNAYWNDVVGNLDASLTFDSLVYDPGTGAVAVSSLFNDAERHQLVRSHEAHNVEFNHWRHCVVGKCGPTARLSWMMGFRYFNFSEDFRFRTDPHDIVFGNQAADEIFYSVELENHLIGFQIGGMGEFCLNDCWQLNGTVKMGVYGNHMVHHSFVGCDTAAEVNNPGSPFHGDVFDISTTKNDVALLGEIDLGARYRWNDCWNFTFGYRALGVTGVGLATNQVPIYFANTGGVRQIDSNGSLILHGFSYVGAEYNY